MRIKNDNTTAASEIGLSQTRESRDAANAAASKPAAIGSPAADSVALTGVRDLVQRAVSSGADARAARINQLKQQIASNQYEVDPLAVSQALISAHLAKG